MRGFAIDLCKYSSAKPNYSSIFTRSYPQVALTFDGFAPIMLIKNQNQPLQKLTYST